MQNVHTILFLSIFVTAFVLYLAAWWSERKPPKNINNYYGYRTKRSMKSQEAWDYAQQIAPVEMKKASYILFGLSVIAYFFKIESEWIIYVLTALIVFLVVFPIVLIERKLKAKYP